MDLRTLRNPNARDALFLVRVSPGYLSWGYECTARNPSSANGRCTNLHQGTSPLAQSGLSLLSPDGSPITTWDDSSGNGFNASIVSPNTPPTLRYNVLNRKPALQFDGMLDKLTGPGDIIASGQTPATIIVVGKVDNYQANPFEQPAYFEVGTHDQTQAYLMMQVPGSFYFANIGNDTATSLANDQQFNIMTAMPNGTNDQVELVVNGMKTPMETLSSSLTPNILQNNYVVGANSTDNNQYLQGKIAEILVYGRVLSDPERETVESYLGKKYGITVPTSLQPTQNLTCSPDMLRTHLH